MTCPMTTGIFLNIVASAAEEAKAKGEIKITPYWRVLKEDGRLNPKFPGGVMQQAKHLREEGFKIIKAKTNDIHSVKDYEKKLSELPKHGNSENSFIWYQRLIPAVAEV